MPELTKDDLISGLRELGLFAGIRVMLHSSYKSFGGVAGGPETVIDALLEVVTESGTLMMPSFNHGRPFRDAVAAGKGEEGVYDPAETPTSNGIIPELFRRRPGVWRSLSPTHPFAARGADAERYVSGHHLTLAVGPESPLGLLWADGGYGLLLGARYGASTFKHVAEMALGVPCFGRRTEEYLVRLPDGRVVPLRTWTYRERRCPITDDRKYIEGEMERRGLHRRGKIGESPATLFKYEDSFGVIKEMLARGYDGHPPCSRCPIRPRKTGRAAELVESDWDAEKGELRPDSPSRGLGRMAYRRG